MANNMYQTEGLRYLFRNLNLYESKARNMDIIFALDVEMKLPIGIESIK